MSIANLISKKLKEKELELENIYEGDIVDLSNTARELIRKSRQYHILNGLYNFVKYITFNKEKEDCKDKIRKLNIDMYEYTGYMFKKIIKQN